MVKFLELPWNSQQVMCNLILEGVQKFHVNSERWIAENTTFIILVFEITWEFSDYLKITLRTWKMNDAFKFFFFFGIWKAARNLGFIEVWSHDEVPAASAKPLKFQDSCRWALNEFLASVQFHDFFLYNILRTHNWNFARKQSSHDRVVNGSRSLQKKETTSIEKENHQQHHPDTFIF